MNFVDAVKILMTSVDIHINQVLVSNPTDDEFNTYFSEDGWGTAQADACRVIKKYLKSKGVGNTYG